MRVQVYEWLRVTGMASVKLPLVKPIKLRVENISSNRSILIANPNRDWQSQMVLENSGILRFIDNKVADRGVFCNTDGGVVSIEQISGANWKINGNDFNTSKLTTFSTDITEIILGNVQTELIFSDFRCGAISDYLKPCKLLSPYQSHQAGECAMIDVLSNTLYFNQGTGAFSVEGEAGEIIDTTPVINNIISPMSTKAVRLREWLVCGDLRKYISIPINSDVDFKLKILKWSDKETISFGRIATETINAEVLLRRNGIYDIWQDGGISTNVSIKETNEFHYGSDDWTINGVSINTKSYTKGLLRTLEYGNWNISHKAEFLLSDISGRYYPAELAIPYDNHPIGECCMIDLLSGDLYFNQGSGGFTCEGAFLGYWQDKPMNDHYCNVEGTLHRSVQIFADAGDRLKLIWEKNKPWEEHRWLVSDVKNSYIRALVNENMELQPKMPLDNGYTIFYYGTHSIWSAGHARHPYAVTSNGTRYFADTECYVMRYPNPHIKVDINAQEIDLEGFKNQWYGGAGQYIISMVDGHRPITIDGHTLTPAVLSRPTLAEEDNNGISRKQGECVFVDEARYKQGLPWVFGNVASSGSFSVSDYLIEGEDYERISGVRSNSQCKINLPCGIVGLSYTIETLSGIVGHADVIADDNGKFCIINYDANNVAFNHNNGWNGYWQFAKDEKHEYTFKYDGQYINGVSWAPVTRTNSGNAIVGGFCVIKSLSYDGVIDLIPVRLLHTIEPTCTHNNKGGKADEIGFFDTISGRFYGNDGSGEFTEYVP